jgi:hypothetical protein
LQASNDANHRRRLQNVTITDRATQDWGEVQEGSPADRRPVSDVVSVFFVGLGRITQERYVMQAIRKDCTTSVVDASCMSFFRDSP